MTEQTYTTSQIAKIVGVHPNTVRMYEEIEFIPKAIRKKNGYRVFTDFHIEQFRLAQIALQIEVLQGGLRKKIIQVIKLSSNREFEAAVKLIKEYIRIAEHEIVSANEAVEITNALLHNKKTESTMSMNRKQAADLLEITIDTLRNWEMNGLIKVKRKENRYRVYDEEDIKRLKIIRTLRVASYSLSAILRMMNLLEDNTDADIKEALNTPNGDEDIISACDRLMNSLEAAKENATSILELLYKMREKYSNPPL